MQNAPSPVHQKFSFLFFPILVFLLLTGLPAQAQDTLGRLRQWTGGFNFGIVGWSPASTQHLGGNQFFTRTLNYGIGTVSDVHGHKSTAVIANTSIGLHGGFEFSDKSRKNVTTIEAEIQRNKTCYSFTPPFYFTTQGDTFGTWVMTDKYLKYSLSIQGSWKYGDYAMLGGPQFIYLRESFGQTFLHRNFNDELQKDKVEDWTENGTGMKATTVAYTPKGFMLSSEVGMRWYSDKMNRSLDFGLVYHAPFNQTYTDEYEFFKQNTSVGKGRITYGGTTVMLNMRYTWGAQLQKRPEKPKPVEPPKDTSVVHGRRVDVESTVTTRSRSIKVWIWDRDEIDGDQISIFLNDQLVLSNYTLKRHKKKIKLHLSPGTNYLVMEAENLGSIPPNTAAVLINDGHKKRNVTVVSDTSKSGAVEINCVDGH